MRESMQPRGRSRRLLFALVAAFCARPAAAEPPARSPVAVVEGLHGALLDSMKHAGQLDLRARSERLMPAVASAYQLDLMARTSLGRYWASLDAAQQKRWLDAFTRLMSATYVSNFDAYSGESFVVDGQDAGTRDTVIVRTRLVTPGDEDVRFDYRLRNGAEGWRIVDEYVDGGISELALRRSEYTAAMQRQGVDALVALLERKAALLLTPKR